MYPHERRDSEVQATEYGTGAVEGAGSGGRGVGIGVDTADVQHAGGSDAGDRGSEY